MIHSAYNILVKFIGLFLLNAPITKPKFSAWQRAQKNIQSQWIELPKHSYLFIVASAGEFEQAKPIIQSLKQRDPETKIVVSFYSPSGFELLKSHHLIDFCIYTPYDTPKNMQRFVEALQPKSAIFVKYELWLNLMSELRMQGIPRFMVSAVFSTNHFIGNWYGKPWRKELTAFTDIFVQDEDSQKLLSAINIPSKIAGDTRVDRSLELPKTLYNDELIEDLSQPQLRLIIGSAWPRDMGLFLEIKDWLEKNNIALMIAPHELDEAFLTLLKNQFNAAVYSELTDSSPRHLIIDVIGKLKYLYRYADVAYVGGGFGKGIHNTLEPAAYALPLIFGPNYEKFVEAKHFVKHGGATVIKNTDELKQAIQTLLIHSVRTDVGNAAKAYLDHAKGATEKIVAQIAN